MKIAMIIGKQQLTLYLCFQRICMIFICYILISRLCYHRCLEKNRKEGFKCTKGGLGQKRGSMSALGRNKRHAMLFLIA